MMSTYLALLYAFMLLPIFAVAEFIDDEDPVGTALVWPFMAFLIAAIELVKGIHWLSTNIVELYKFSQE